MMTDGDFRLIRRYFGIRAAIWYYVRRAYLRFQVYVGFEIGLFLLFFLVFELGFWLGGMNRG